MTDQDNRNSTKEAYSLNPPPLTAKASSAGSSAAEREPASPICPAWDREWTEACTLQ